MAPSFVGKSIRPSGMGSGSCPGLPRNTSDRSSPRSEGETPSAKVRCKARVGSCEAYPVNGIYNGQIRLLIPTDMVYVGCGCREIFLGRSPWCNPFAYFTENEQQANWIFARFGRSRADRVQWLSPIFGQKLACVCGRSCCRATVLDELVQDVLPRPCVHSSGESTRGAIANEGYECSSRSSRNFILNSSVASHRDVSYWHRRRPAWPESWTALCQEIRSFQCRCFWVVSPCDATLSDSFRNTMWNVAPPRDAEHNPDFNVRNPVLWL